jgi:hypothetical protein
MSKQTLFVVTDQLQQVLDNLPAVEPRSRLDPLRPFILRWRRDGRSYRKIRAILKNECGVVVCCETIRKFVKSRSKPRKPQPEPEIEQPLIAPLESPQSVSTGKKLTPEERAAQVAYIRSLNQPTLQEKPEKSRWNFDVDKPRTIHKP